MKSNAFFSRPIPLLAVCVLAAVLSAGADEPAGAAKSPPESKAAAETAEKLPYRNVRVAEFARLREGGTNVVLDVRTVREYNMGHIPGAVNLDFNAPDFKDKVKALDKSKLYLVHCAVGGRSAKACKLMSTIQFTNLVNLDGGFNAWKKDGKPVEP